MTDHNLKLISELGTLLLQSGILGGMVRYAKIAAEHVRESIQWRERMESRVAHIERVMDANDCMACPRAANRGLKGEQSNG